MTTRCVASPCSSARAPESTPRPSRPCSRRSGPRGEVEETLLDDEALLGTHRLRIVDRDRAVQPWTSADGRWALSYNGEIFNFEALREQLLERGPRAALDAPTPRWPSRACSAWGEDALLRFRGEFAFGLVDRHTRRVFLARDPAGVKPLYWTLVDGRLAVASEVKSLVGPLGHDIVVHEVPPGHCGWAEPGAAPELHPYIDLLRLGEGQPMVEDLDDAIDLVRRDLPRGGPDAGRHRPHRRRRSSPAGWTAH